MKKYLSILGLLVFLSAPAFACSSCGTSQVYLPRVQAVAVPMAAPCNTCLTGAACPIVEPCNTCNTCLTGAAYPIVEPCNTCNSFIQGVSYPNFHNNYY